MLALVFKIADDNGLLLLDLKDLRAMLQHVGDNAAQFTTAVRQHLARRRSAPSSAACCAREPGRRASSSASRCSTSPTSCRRDGAAKGVVNILAADKLMNSPKLYATFLLWLLSELFEHLPEVGDPDKPKLVFFFDEAHLLFDEAPKALLEKIEQVVRLVRSKGVGVYFVTQNPLDMPESVLGQLGNRVQHALRAFTPRDQKAVKAAADDDAPEPEARHRDGRSPSSAWARRWCRLLDEKGSPSVVERAFVVPAGEPASARSRDDERAQLIAARSVVRRLREDGRPRIGLREAEGPHRGEAGASREAKRPTRSRTSCSARPGRAADGSRRASSRR